MVFRELKQGYPLYILNRGSMEIMTGQVTNVSSTHVTQDKSKLANGNMMMCIDVTINIGGKTQVIELPEGISSTMSNDQTLFISANKEDIINGIRLIKAQCEEAIKMVPQHKDTIKKCETLLQDFDPSYKQAIDNEQRITAMQSFLDEQKKMNQELLSIVRSQQEDIKFLKNSIAKK